MDTLSLSSKASLPYSVKSYKKIKIILLINNPFPSISLFKKERTIKKGKNWQSYKSSYNKFIRKIRKIGNFKFIYRMYVPISWIFRTKKSGKSLIGHDIPGMLRFFLQTPNHGLLLFWQHYCSLKFWVDPDIHVQIYFIFHIHRFLWLYFLKYPKSVKYISYSC